MRETRVCVSQPSTDLSILSFGPGAFAVVVAAMLGGGCSSRKEPQLVTKPTPAPTVVPADALVAESTQAFNVGVTLGKKTLVYFNATGRHESYFSHTREFSINKSAATEQGGLAGWDVSVSEKDQSLKVRRSDFEAWREAQMADLQSRSEVQEAFKIRSSGVLFSTDGSVFLTFLIGGRIQMRALESVEPLVVSEDQQ